MSTNITPPPMPALPPQPSKKSHTHAYIIGDAAIIAAAIVATGIAISGSGNDGGEARAHRHRDRNRRD
jgi:hypothetical protein